MFFNRRKDDTTMSLNDEINIENLDPELDDMDADTNDEETVSENLESEESLMRDEKELKDIAMKIYQEYTDSALNLIRNAYADKNSDSLSFKKEKTLNDLRKRFEEDDRGFSKPEIDKMLDIIDSRVYRYDILDQFIEDDEISDIKCYSYKNVRIKRRGQRFPANVCFNSGKEYKDFVTRILERNNINFGTANANQTFTDNTQKDAKLRISCISELLTDSNIPCVAIRKIQKEKRTLVELCERGMFDKIPHPKNPVPEMLIKFNEMVQNDELRAIIPDLINAKGVLFTGKGASGKTTLMNALLELIPHNESIMICQENSELFIKDHPDCLCTSVLTNNGDSKISYGLSDLTRMGLLIDLDRIIVGEIKQPDEAEGLSKASITGHKCWTSVHGENCHMAIDKMADYISQANKNYTFTDSLKQLQGFEYVVHLSEFQVDEIVKITGWDHERNNLITETVYSLNV